MRQAATNLTARRIDRNATQVMHEGQMRSRVGLNAMKEQNMHTVSKEWTG